MNKLQGREVAHPGIGSEVADQEDPERYHSYYQWVPFMLFFQVKHTVNRIAVLHWPPLPMISYLFKFLYCQGVLFYIPHWVWKNWEEGKVRMVTDGIRGAVVGTKQMRIDKQNRLVQYFVDTLHMHNVYAAGYFLCEVLNFINVVSEGH